MLIIDGIVPFFLKKTSSSRTAKITLQTRKASWPAIVIDLRNHLQCVVGLVYVFPKAAEEKRHEECKDEGEKESAVEEEDGADADDMDENAGEMDA